MIHHPRLTYGDIHFDRFRKRQLLLSRSFVASLAIEEGLLRTISFGRISI
jgi:hypothetical protein